MRGWISGCVCDLETMHWDNGGGKQWDGEAAMKLVGVYYGCGEWIGPLVIAENRCSELLIRDHGQVNVGKQRV